MPRRLRRTDLVHRLVSPVTTRIRRPIQRQHRQVPLMPLRWSPAQRLVTRPIHPLRRGRTAHD